VVTPCYIASLYTGINNVINIFYQLLVVLYSFIFIDSKLFSIFYEILCLGDCGKKKTMISCSLVEGSNIFSGRTRKIILLCVLIFSLMENKLSGNSLGTEN
jgi:hypothetical protein